MLHFACERYNIDIFNTVFILFSLFQHKKGGDFSSDKVYTLFLMKNCYYERKKKFYKNMNSMNGN